MNFGDLKKVESSGARPVVSDRDALVTAIIRVNSPNYLPKGVSLRSKVGPFLFTAEFPAKQLEILESDANVEAVSISRPMPLQKLPAAG